MATKFIRVHGRIVPINDDRKVTPDKKKSDQLKNSSRSKSQIKADAKRSHEHHQKMKTAHAVGAVASFGLAGMMMKPFMRGVAMIQGAKWESAKLRKAGRSLLDRAAKTGSMADAMRAKGMANGMMLNGRIADYGRGLIRNRSVKGLAAYGVVLGGLGALHAAGWRKQNQRQQQKQAAYKRKLNATSV